MSHPTLFDDQPGGSPTSADALDPAAVDRGLSPETGCADAGRPGAAGSASDLRPGSLLDAVDNANDSGDSGDVGADVDEADGFEVVVIRSARRKRSVGAQLRGRVLQITVPTWMSRIEEEKWVSTMVARYQRKQATDLIDLKDRAMTLARRHDLPFPREIRWVDDMTTRWGSCTPSTGTIRMSSRLGKFPAWVVDYVIVHELSHLEHADHSAAFWKTVHRYPKAERAIGYLIAKSGDVEWED